MRELTELVDLPDADVQPLVHPLDLCEARRPFRRAQLITALTNPAMGVCLAAIVWFATHGFLPPLIMAAAIIAFGALASHLDRERAWAFIPRNRQDRHRTLPLSWDVGASVVLAAALAVVLILVAVRLGQSDVSTEVRRFTFGMAAGTALLMVGDAVTRVLRKQGRRALLGLPSLFAVAGSLAAATSHTLSGTPHSTTSPTVFLGLITMLGIGVLVGGWKYREHQHRVVAH
ncbi:hypothetical protein SAMN04487820_102277 [Actinopolyspora mzabensis]|uniref:Uncharacterized protein n=1 Tax=Actinopolyspora mzabensis TaxID=995066 RepID=A0A1G8WYC0_ACTMZ|nr:hypothetical protein [Actinopolyspora mzabensis]SDJ83047.1 hypothetical protein SAMN04487820_102277 [Actinopolyspora mzabensis]